MQTANSLSRPRFVVATPARSVCDDNARAFAEAGMLRLYCLGTRRGTAGIPSDQTRLFPVIGALSTATAKLFGAAKAEPFRFRLHPLFDHWVKSQLRPGDHIISSYGYTNACFKWVRKHGGKTFLDAGNSHPQNYWDILTEEHRRWGISSPPIARHHYERSLAMLEDVDYVLSPSRFVTDSFLQRGFSPEQIIPNVYPVDLSLFRPPDSPRPADRPLTLINTGSLSLRKGTPYLLEAFRMIRKQIPTARLLLTKAVSTDMKNILHQYEDLPIEWFPAMPHAQLALHLQSADIFILPSLEDGFARTVTEALFCGLPVILTPNTGASDFIVPERNGSIVEIRNVEGIAEKTLLWWDQIRTGFRTNPAELAKTLSFHCFAKSFLNYCENISNP